MRLPVPTRRRAAAVLAVGATAAGLTAWNVAPAHADIERHGTCAGARYEFGVDRERGGFEVSFDLDRARPGSRWVVALRHDGKRYFHRTLTAHRDDDDRDGEIDLERFRRNTAGADVLSVRFRPAGTHDYCTAKVRTR